MTLGPADMEGASGITCTVPTPTYTSNVATTLSIKPPGVLAFCKDAAGYPLTVAASPNGVTFRPDPYGLDTLAMPQMFGTTRIASID